MKYFRIPQPLIVKVSDQSAPLPFAAFMENIANDEKLGKSLAGIRTSVALMAAVTSKEPGDLVTLSDGDYDRAKGIVEEPTNGYLPAVMRQILGYVDALLGATNEPPASE